jgi:hypothetical protein
MKIRQPRRTHDHEALAKAKGLSAFSLLSSEALAKADWPFSLCAGPAKNRDAPIKIFSTF